MGSIKRPYVANRPRTFVQSLELRLLLSAQIGTVLMAEDGYLSAGVYDEGGHLIRTLLNHTWQQAGDVPLVWDGRDAYGQTVTQGGNYSWRALASQVEVVDQGGIGDSLFNPNARFPNIGAGSDNALIEAQEMVQGLATGPDNSLYALSDWEEGPSLVKYNQSGAAQWGNTGYWGTSVAVDSNAVYTAWRRPDNNIEIHRASTANGAWGTFTGVASGFITVHATTWPNYDPRPAGQEQYTQEDERDRAGVLGMASDGSRLFVSNYRSNQLEVYIASTGVKFTNTLPLNNPLGVAVTSTSATAGVIWVANNKDRVSRYTYTISGNTVTFSAEDTARRISGLSDPGGVAIGGTNGHLFVAQGGNGQIRVYNIAGATPTPAGIQTLGSLHQSGPITDTEFYFPIWANITVDSTGILSVNDFHRVQRFHTEGAQAGTLYQSWQGQWSGSPTDTYGYSADGVHRVLDGNIEYEVDPEYTGGPRAGWLGDGSWRMTARYYVEGVGVRRTLMDGGTPREFVFTMALSATSTERNVIAYALEPGGTRRAAIVGTTWRGNDRMGTSQGGQYVWTDTDKDGAIDGGSAGSGIDGEVNWFINKGQTPQIRDTRPWIDDLGNIWLTEPDGDLIKVPLEGFDNGNPIYNWFNKVTVVSAQSDYASTTVRIAGNGDIYGLGGGPFRVGQGVNSTGDHIAHYNSSGERTFQTPVPDLGFVAIAHDDGDTDSEYFFAATGASDQQIIYMYRDDGLLVNKFQYGAASGYTGGWLDYVYGLAAFTHPTTNETYVYAQDVYYGKSERYRIDNTSSITDYEDNFTWSAPADVRGYWPLDGNLNDLAGEHHGTFVNGTATYSSGRAGNALAFDGVNDNVDISYPGYFEAYTISAWVKADAGGLASRNIISRTDNGNGPSNGYIADTIRINSAGQFEHYTYSNGQGKTVASTTTVAADTWYHVAISSRTDGIMRLYVNGVEEGAAQAVTKMWWQGNRFNIGTATNFTVGGAFDYFKGQVDDVHIFESVLTSTQIQAMYAGTTPTLTVAATDAVATEAAGNSGTFTITRNCTTGDQTVNYLVRGTATNGVDYTTLPGTATIANGQSSTSVVVAPSEDAFGDYNETVTVLILGTSSNIASPAEATIAITDNDPLTFSTNPGWTGYRNAADGNSFGYSPATNHAGGATGEIGGAFAHHNGESYFADTDLKRTFNLDDVLEASGKFNVFGQSGSYGEWFLGHLSSDTTDQSIMGIQFQALNSTSVQVRARMGHPSGTGADGDWQTLPNGAYSFEYRYDPNVSAQEPYGGVGGRLTIRIFNGSGFNLITGVDMDYDRFDPATFDAFGIGIRGERDNNIPSGTVKMFVDDMNYTGKRQPITALPAWVTGGGASWDAGANTLTVTGAATVVADPAGFVDSDHPIIDVIGGNLTIAPTTGAIVHIGELNLSGSAVVTLAPGGAVDRVLVVEGAFDIADVSTLDLSDNAMIAKGTGLSAISDWIASAYNDGDWLGSGLTSSTASNDPTLLTALGYVSNADPLCTEFEGVTGLDSNDVLIKYTYYGDSNLSGTTDLDDFPLYIFGLEDPSAPQTWYYGDYNCTGEIDVDDFPLFIAGLEFKGLEL